MRICFLILSAPYQPWKSLFENCAKRTWIAELQKGDNAFVYTGKTMNRFLSHPINLVLKSRYSASVWQDSITNVPKARFQASDAIAIDIKERWDTMLHKFIGAASLVCETFDFDFLVKVNTTTYVNVQQLKIGLSEFLGKDYWGGVISKDGQFTVGWASVFSIKTINGVLNHINESKPIEIGSKFEDEALGRLMMSLGMKPKSIVGVRAMRSHEIPGHQLKEIPFIRIKSESNRGLLDPQEFAKVHSLMQSQP